MNIEDLIRRLECGPIDVVTAEHAAAAIKRLQAEVKTTRAEGVRDGYQKSAEFLDTAADKAMTDILEEPHASSDFGKALAANARVTTKVIKQLAAQLRAAGELSAEAAKI